MQITAGTLNPAQQKTSDQTHDAKLIQAAEQLEASFLAEMLKAAGLGETPSTFGGAQGEDQFASFMVQAQAEKMVEAGGIGLAQQLYETLKGHE